MAQDRLKPYRINQLPASDKQSLMGLERADFFTQTFAIADTIITQRAPYFNHLQRFGYDRQPVAHQALVTSDFSGADDSNGEFASLLKLSSQRQDIARGIALAHLTGGADLGFNPTERVVVEEGLRIASVMDQVFFGWKRLMVTSKLGKEMAQMGAEEASQWLTNNGLDNPYTVLSRQKGSDRISQTPYAAAFPKQYQALDEIVGRLIARLQNQHPDRETVAFEKYFQAFKDASAEINPDQLEKRWREVDWTWMDIQGPLQPVHAMESYAEPARLRVDPEFRVVVEDPNAQALNDQARRTQQQLIEDYLDGFSGYQTLEGSIPAMRSSMVRAISTLIMSGSNLNFRAAGQNVPNRADVRVEKGAKIFLDPVSMEFRFAQMKKLVGHVFGEDFARREFVDPGALVDGGIEIAGHEVSHSAFVTPETDGKIGSTLVSLIEEAKADFGGIAFIPEQVQRGEITPEQVKTMIALRLGHGLRYFLYRGNDQLEPYYNIAVMDFNLLISSGVVFKSDGKWSVDLSNDRIANYFGQVKTLFREFADTYENQDPEKAQNILTNYKKETPEVLELVDSVKSVG